MNRSRAVIDSGVALLRTLNTAALPAAAALWDRLLRNAISLYAPRLWAYEITSVVHRYLFDGALASAEAEDVLRVVFGLEVTLVDEDESLCLEALRWATRLNQRPAYDAFYLALAESLHAEFWTADRRLYSHARQAGLDWVHHMAEAAPEASES